MTSHLQQHVQQHLQQQLGQHVPHYFAYMLPRATLVLLGWGAAYWILTALSTHLPPVAMGVSPRQVVARRSEIPLSNTFQLS